MKSSGADDRGCPRLLQKSNKYIAGQLGFLLPLAKKSELLNTDKKHRGADGSSSRRTAENRGCAMDIVICIWKMIEQSTSNVYRLARGCARWQTTTHLRTLCRASPVS